MFSTAPALPETLICSAAVKTDTRLLGSRRSFTTLEENMAMSSEHLKQQLDQNVTLLAEARDDLKVACDKMENATATDKEFWLSRVRISCSSARPHAVQPVSRKATLPLR
jgi:hypothetical protein